MFDFIRRWMGKPVPQPGTNVPQSGTIQPPVSARPVPRGLRNRSPGNIRYTGEGWYGMKGVDPDGFVQFDTPQNGIRAIGIILRNYERKHHLDTVRMIINRWAPPSENNTGAYVMFVAGALGVEPDRKIDVHHRDTLATLVRAIIQMETGERQPYPPSIVMSGVDAALRA
jgi:hypothetical protein